MNQNSTSSDAKAHTSANSDEEEWSGAVECAAVEKPKCGSRSESNRRKRTIIVEKKNGSYGFTLQSYGIHYKREQEIEMVTYVDYVEYNGPAFKAGMREGDVIVSINGQEMDRADHKTLVNFIKNCDTRMRMVVSFEDCVKKVEIHMRYIELQRALQSRLNKLERLCEQERSILMGKWKTHSLPARKRTGNSATGNDSDQPLPSTNFGSTSQCCRPTASSEHLLLYNVYSDGRSFLIPRTGGACLVAVGPPRSRSDHYNLLSSKNSTEGISTSSSSRHSYHQANGNTPSKAKSQTKQTCEGIVRTGANSLCVSCISSASRRKDNGDAGSLDAYDLAGSPCCEPNCVPTRRRREKQRRSTKNEQQQQQHNCSRSSEHSLHSITSSDVSTAAESVASCSTSLSTDTLYWDPNTQRQQQCLQYAKPKSWDNLTTKAFGGYGFGYGYVDTTTIKSHNSERSSKSSHARTKTPTVSVQRRSSSTNTGYTSSGSRHFQPNKSTESLLVPAQYKVELDGSVSCECLDGHNTRFITVQLEKHKRQDNGYTGGQQQARHRRSSHSDNRNRAGNNSEATRL